MKSIRYRNAERRREYSYSLEEWQYKMHAPSLFADSMMISNMKAWLSKLCKQTCVNFEVFQGPPSTWHWPPLSYPVLSFDSPSPALLCYHVGVVALYPDHVTSTQFGIEWPGIFRDWRLKKKKKSDLEWNFRTRGNEPTISPSSHHPISSNQAEPTLFYPIFYPLLVSFSPCRPAPTTKPNNVLAGEEEIPLLICDWESDQIQIFCSVLASM